ncbi:MAG: hypothetical protein MJ247_03940 [Alphaproteobacteria bacterium]|nr:hypothetical protein [Alphaproteobacteria bacterium]
MFSNNFINALKEYNFNSLPNTKIVENRFTRWGRNNKYWAIANDFGITFGDYSRDIKDFVPFEKKDILINNDFYKAQENYKAASISSNYEKISKYVTDQWKHSNILYGHTHNYLIKKKISGLSLRILNDTLLLVPLYDANGKIWSMQYITPDGKKFLKKGGKAKGNFTKIGTYKKRIFLCEGYATGETIYKATNECTVACISACYLIDAAINIRNKYPDTEFVFCSDNDQYGLRNTGKECAINAAKIVNGHVIFPFFKDYQLSKQPTDFNDLYCLEGLDSVRHQIYNIWGIKYDK